VPTKTQGKGPATTPAGPQCRKPGAGEGGLRAPGTTSIRPPSFGSGKLENFLRGGEETPAPVTGAPATTAVPRGIGGYVDPDAATHKLRLCAAGSFSRADPCGWPSSK